MKLITNPCTSPHVSETHPNKPDTNAGKSIPAGGSAHIDVSNIIQNAMCFASKDTT